MVDVMVDAELRELTWLEDRIKLRMALLFFSLPFSSFGSSFIDYQLYRLARPSCRARASIDWVANKTDQVLARTLLDANRVYIT